MRIHLLLAVLCTLLFLPTAQANDAASEGLGGRALMLKGEHKSVQMVRESVQIDVYDIYKPIVTADFWFSNHGPATKVTMGFPESSIHESSTDEAPIESGFGFFYSWVDDKPVEVRRVRSTGRDPKYDALWMKEVDFGPEQTRHVRVQYRGGHSGYSNGDCSVSYQFTGGNWQGKVEESLLRVTFHGRGAVWPSLGGNLPKPVEQEERSYLWRWRDWQADYNFDLVYQWGLPNALTDGTVPAQSSGESKYRPLISFGVFRTGVMLPPAVFRQGRVWVNTRWVAEDATTGQHLSLEWDYRRQGVQFYRGTSLKRQPVLFVSAKGAAEAAKAGVYPFDRPFWADEGGGCALFVPLESLRPLGIKFVIDWPHSLIKAIPGTSKLPMKKARSN
jgi:hypothetical protein